MQDWFAVHDLDVERLLVDWRWLCKEPVLLARNAFGDLFLRNQSGQVHQLDVAIGKLTKVTDSEAEFRELALSIERQEEWFAVADENAAIARGLEPNHTQCIGFSVPLVFAESGSPDTAYLADLYEHRLVSWGLEPPNRRASRGSEGQTSRWAETVRRL